LSAGYLHGARILPQQPGEIESPNALPTGPPERG
jgi:hypothetical protein